MDIDVPDMAQGFQWDYGFEITVLVEANTTTLRANKAGLVSLARHILALAQDSVPSGDHFHLDDMNSLEEGSGELVVEKV